VRLVARGRRCGARASGEKRGAHWPPGDHRGGLARGARARFAHEPALRRGNSRWPGVSVGRPAGQRYVAQVFHGKQHARAGPVRMRASPTPSDAVLEETMHRGPLIAALLRAEPAPGAAAPRAGRARL